MRLSHRIAARVATLSLAVLATASLSTRLEAQEFTLAAGDTTVAAHDSVATAPVSGARRGTTAATAGAPLTGLRSAVHLRETARPLTPNAAATRAGLGQSQAMMIVGAAALITGAIIGGDPGTIIMVGGAVIGLYGLYQYLQ